MTQIKVTHVYPPIPLRQFDWSAHVEGTEDVGMAIGYGRNIKEAIDSLIESVELKYNEQITNYKWQ